MKSKTASVRLPKDMYDEIDGLCDGMGCTRNDWIKDTLKDKLREESNSEGKTEEQEPKKEPQKITLTHIGNNEPFRPSKGVQLTEI